ncbi:MAG: hypothetical protein M1818_008502 [Claussenomyces sp. TS43310]|nr:MAG: hypothetical protein M1818_008502 [Claussenomyces sp. TS43310]
MRRSHFPLLLSLLPVSLAFDVPSQVSSVWNGWDGSSPSCAQSCYSSVYASYTGNVNWGDLCATPTATAQAAVSSCLASACSVSDIAPLVTAGPSWACSAFSALATCTAGGDCDHWGPGWGVEHTDSSGRDYWIVTGDSSRSEGWETRTETITTTVGSSVSVVTSVRTGSVVAAQVATQTTSTATTSATSNGAAVTGVLGLGALAGVAIGVVAAL